MNFDLFAGWPSAIAWGGGAALVVRGLGLVFLIIVRAVQAAGGTGRGDRDED